MEKEIDTYDLQRAAGTLSIRSPGKIVLAARGHSVLALEVDNRCGGGTWFTDLGNRVGKLVVRVRATYVCHVVAYVTQCDHGNGKRITRSSVDRAHRIRQDTLQVHPARPHPVSGQTSLGTCKTGFRIARFLVLLRT